jgi:hypothetical protein
MVPRSEAMPEPSIYRIVFISQGQIYEIYARRVTQGNLFGFIEVEDFVFGEKTQVVIDPAEERLKSEFEGVRRTHLPMHAIVRVDEVEREGKAKITAAPEPAGTVTPFPYPLSPPRGGGRKP